jgi:hypothetical protein
MNDLKVYGSLHIEMHVDMDVDRMQCITSAVKSIADRRGMGFRVSDVTGFYEKLKELDAPEDLLELFRDSNFVALTLRDGGTGIKFRLYIDRERKKISRIELKTHAIKRHSVAGSAIESLSNAVADIEAMQRALSMMREVLDAAKSCLQQGHSQIKCFSKACEKRNLSNRVCP